MTDREKSSCCSFYINLAKRFVFLENSSSKSRYLRLVTLLVMMIDDGNENSSRFQTVFPFRRRRRRSSRRPIGSS